jgi:hypothetical protein
MLWTAFFLFIVIILILLGIEASYSSFCVSIFLGYGLILSVIRAVQLKHTVRVSIIDTLFIICQYFGYFDSRFRRIWTLNGLHYLPLDNDWFDHSVWKSVRLQCVQPYKYHMVKIVYFDHILMIIVWFS